VTPPRLLVDASRCTVADLAPAVDWLRMGRIVAFPTDTFYGLAVDATSDQAVRDLFDLKGREARAALPLIAGSVQQVDAWCGPQNAMTRRLASLFWPGPLSLVLDAPPIVAVAVHGGSRAIAVRVPAHHVARTLADAWGAPVTATSANRSGEPAVRSADALGLIAASDRVLVVDGGDTPGGAPSTIVDARGSAPRLLRDGAIAWNRVLESLEG
jgi:L-threonylcarbamoyladenylate synthase